MDLKEVMELLLAGKKVRYANDISARYIYLKDGILYYSDGGRVPTLDTWTEYEEWVEEYDFNTAMQYAANGGEVQRIGWSGRIYFDEYDEYGEPNLFYKSEHGSKMEYTITKGDVKATDWILL